MPATDSAMGPPGGMMGSSMGSGSGTTNGWAGPSILGFLAFGLTSILFGLGALPKPYNQGFLAYAGGGVITDGILGGLVLLIIGIIGFLRGHNYWGAAFMGYGAFWISWAAIGANFWALFAAPNVAGFAFAGFAFIWVLFSLSFLASSMKHGWGTFLGILLVTISMILLLVEGWTLGGGHTVSSGEMWATGGLWIFTGLLWWLHGTSELTNHTYGRKVIPL